MTPNAVQKDELRLHLTVLRCQTGDERAFASLMDEFGSRTLGYLAGLLGDDAEDVQQEVWLSVYRRIGELASPAAFRTWLFRITRHRAIDHLRKHRRERELLVDESPEDVAALLEEVSEPRLDPVAFETAIAGLPPPQREVLLLRYRDDLSYNEIAVVVGIPIGTVKTRLHHAKQKLNDALQREGI